MFADLQSIWNEGRLPKPEPRFEYDLNRSTNGCSRLSAWQEILNQYYYPLELRSGAARFQVGRIALYDFGTIRVGYIESDPMTVEIQRAHTSRSSDDYIMIPITASHELGLQERNRECRIRSGDIGFIATGSPYTYHQPERTVIAAVRLPAQAVREVVPYIDDLTARRFDRDAPAVRLFNDFLRSTLRHGAELDESRALLLRRSLLDLFALAVTAPMSAEVDESSTRLAHRQRVYSYIDAHVRDADLNSGKICAALGLSDRYVQKILAEHGETLTELVRQRKMIEARRFLRDQRLKSLTVEEIAYRLGYLDAAYFSRQFRRETGVSPSEFRKG